MTTGSGNQKLLFNTRERALSSDSNRAQSFAGRAAAESWRFLLDATAEEDTHAGALEVMGAGADTPLRAVVFAGIRVRPEIGTVNLFVTPGEILIVDSASPTADDSSAALVSDPGVITAGVLTLTAGSGSVRIDVVECQRVDVVTEIDNRDIFNPATGLFTPAQVNKVVTSQLTYRIRTGTPGSGFPGIAAGWVPLAVCCVSSAATTWDDVKLWDVRPLASDRWNAPFDNPLSFPQKGRQMVWTDVITNAAQRRAAGIVEVAFKGYRAGGRLGLTNEAIGYFDYAAAANYARNFVAGWTANHHWYVYAVFPFGLPRWVAYSSVASGARVPVGQRGILAVTTTPPAFNGLPQPTGIGVNSPAITGLQDPNTATNAICLFCGRIDDVGPLPLGVGIDGTVTTHINPTVAAIAKTTSVDTPDFYAQWTLVDDVDMPAGARAIYVSLFATVTSAGADVFSIGHELYVTAGNAALASEITVPMRWVQPCDFGTGAETLRTGITMRIPLVNDPFNPTTGAAGPARSFKLQWFYVPNGHSTVITFASQTLQVLGWEMGP